MRDLVREVSFSEKDLIWPVFVREETIPRDIQRMPGVYRYCVSELVSVLEPAVALGLRAVALFPVIDHEKRTPDAQEAFCSENILCQAIALLKKSFPDLGVITDAALDAFTDHGHDGFYQGGDVANDASVDAIARHALLQAQMGADIIAPSDMMDGRIQAIRRILEDHTYGHIGIMSYGAKYASHFYGPFREALGSDRGLGKGNKKTYQLDPANSDEALREVALDLAEGADSILIKPGLPYLDVIHRVKEEFRVPTFAFHVSGEYAMLRAAAAADMLTYEEALLETLLCFKRAGADGVVTYGAVDLLKMLSSEKKTERRA